MSELTTFVNESIVGPLLFIVICIFIFAILLMVVYYTLLRNIIPEKIAIVLGLVGAVGILYLCTENFEWVRGFVKNFI